MEKRYKTHQ